MDSFSTATRTADGYLVTGLKVFTTLSPVWTRLGVHAKYREDGEEPSLVFGFVRRDALTEGTPRTKEQASEGLRIGTLSHPGEWNTLGMRATQSWTTKLDGVP